MAGVILIILILLWLFGYIMVPGITLPGFPIFYFNNHPVNLWDILVFFLIIALIGYLPKIFKVFLFVILVVWGLSVLRIFYFTGLPSLLLLVVIIGIAISLLG